MPPMSPEEVVELLRSKQTTSLRALAGVMHVSAAYLGDVLAGKRTPGPSVLDFLGLERIVIVQYQNKARKKRA